MDKLYFDFSGGATKESILAQLIAACDNEYHHRAYDDVKDILANFAISDGARKLANDVYSVLARAESSVHGMSLDETHVHEVGNTDALVHILTSCVLMDKLSPASVTANPMALGSGTIICAHGELPVPAPATAKILETLPDGAYHGGGEGELTTPTGAAMAAAFVTDWEI
ncbi:MAG: LarC family nickel insertion protein [Coriobacteriales bacterium]|jgi:uncharacterized protein (DUF111 family)|nr:LarC family nickel insertion protein [Coriobacteriales bacterium]